MRQFLSVFVFTAVLVTLFPQSLWAAAPACKHIFLDLPDNITLKNHYEEWQQALPEASPLKRSYFSDASFPKRKAIDDSFTKIVFNSGTALYNGHLFVDSYYLSHLSRIVNHDEFFSGSLHQPWGEWNPGSAKWIYHASGAGQKIKDLLPRRIILYRGLSRSEGNFLKGLKSRIENLSEKDAFDTVRNAFAGRGPVFTSPERKASHWWSKGYGADGLKKTISSFEVDLHNLSAEKDLYLGIEVDYIEIAFLTTKAKLALVRGLQIKN